jgi:hypothetical protein
VQVKILGCKKGGFSGRGATTDISQAQGAWRQWENHLVLKGRWNSREREKGIQRPSRDAADFSCVCQPRRSRLISGGLSGRENDS